MGVETAAGVAADLWMPAAAEAVAAGSAALVSEAAITGAVASGAVGAAEEAAALGGGLGESAPIAPTSGIETLSGSGKIPGGFPPAGEFIPGTEAYAAAEASALGGGLSGSAPVAPGYSAVEEAAALGAGTPAETIGGPSTTQIGTEAAKSATSQAAKGLLGDAQTPPKEGDPGWLEWFKKNKELATLGATTAMGALGGVGQAALARETAQKRLQGEKDMQAKTIQANSDLLAQRTQEQLNLSRGGALVNPSLPTPAGRTLRRPDGSLVFVPASGLIANAIR